ncbi:melanocortin-2 receptor accessory protein 2B-like [Carassius carassius]|uniref:melanocortin-2 receptor accessory protein 2B-like n=1 Tax=Carassius carassius TaxID=217509 RepID=UPI002868ACC6|nr:melanocortin-2 receptor accessory protein 2B-like [Carassius carassius]
MSEYSNQSQSGSDYEWHYEYYDDEKTMSFEGLRANRYSIVIGFWVGLAVFVIFMFFVLTLLTKTVAPHPDEKHHGLADCVLELSGSQAFPLLPLPDQSHSLFRFNIHEEAVRDTVRGRCCGRGPGLRLQGAAEDEHFLFDSHIPNFVSSEQCSSISNDDFLLCELPIITDSQSAAPKS